MQGKGARVPVLGFVSLPPSTPHLPSSIEKRETHQLGRWPDASAGEKGQGICDNYNEFFLHKLEALVVKISPSENE